MSLLLDRIFRSILGFCNTYNPSSILIVADCEKPNGYENPEGGHALVRVGNELECCSLVAISSATLKPQRLQLKCFWPSTVITDTHSNFPSKGLVYLESEIKFQNSFFLSMERAPRFIFLMTWKMNFSIFTYNFTSFVNENCCIIMDAELHLQRVREFSITNL